jgi:RNA polymerase sigma factor (sigma-70 family)
MYYPFSEKTDEKIKDEDLIKSALGGNKHSLEELIKRHQNWIYNLSLRMVFYPDDAKDITQEVLIKIITKLGTFEGKSSFKTWLYKIVVNHIRDLKQIRGEKNHYSDFKSYASGIDKTPDNELPDRNSLPVDSDIIVEEVKLTCMYGMLLCLKRESRLAFILGSIFGVPDSTGAEIMEISSDNYRQKLSRARKEIYNFMNEKCGLIHSGNSCLCSRKAKALLDSEEINPQKLNFNVNYTHRVKHVIEKKLSDLNSFVDEKCEKLFTEHPYQNSPDFVMYLRGLLNTNEFKEIFNFN